MAHLTALPAAEPNAGSRLDVRPPGLAYSLLATRSGGPEAVMTTNVILHIRGKPGTGGELLRGAYEIGAVRASEPAFHGGTHYVDQNDAEHIIEVQAWDSPDAQQAFMAKIRGDFAWVFELLAEPPDVTYADER